MAQPRVSVICIFYQAERFGARAGFAYPHGDWDAASRAEVIAAGYSWAVAVGFACVDPHRFDRFALPRLPAGERTGDELELAIRQADR